MNYNNNNNAKSFAYRNSSINSNNQNDILQRILNAVEDMKKSHGARLDSLELKLSEALHSQNPLLEVDQELIETLNNNTGPIPLSKYASPKVRAHLLACPNQFSARDIDFMRSKNSNCPQESNQQLGADVSTLTNNKPKSDPDNSINRRLTKLMVRLWKDEYGSYESSHLTEQKIAHMKKKFARTASKVCILAPSLDLAAPSKWKNVSADEKNYYCLILEHVAYTNDFKPPGIYRCINKWAARGFLQLAWKSIKTDDDKNKESTSSQQQNKLGVHRSANNVPTRRYLQEEDHTEPHDDDVYSIASSTGSNHVVSELSEEEDNNLLFGMHQPIPRRQQQHDHFDSSSSVIPPIRRLIKQESDEESDEEEDFSAFEDARRELLQREHAEENRVVEWDIAVQDIVAAGEDRQNTSKERRPTIKATKSTAAKKGRMSRPKPTSKTGKKAAVKVGKLMGKGSQSGKDLPGKKRVKSTALRRSKRQAARP